MREQITVVMGMHIDKAGRDHTALGIDLFPCALATQITDRRHPVAGNGDIRLEAVGAGAINHGTVADDDVRVGHALGGHQINKTLEQIVAVLGAGGGLGVILYREYGLALDPDALNGTIKQGGMAFHHARR